MLILMAVAVDIAVGRSLVSGVAQRGPTLVVEHLTKRFGARVAYADVCFEVGYGEAFGFLGPNRAGKTTTVRTWAHSSRRPSAQRPSPVSRSP
jgi:ABC-type uncharacterized transport system ATPase subunit